MIEAFGSRYCNLVTLGLDGAAVVGSGGGTRGGGGGSGSGGDGGGGGGGGGGGHASNNGKRKQCTTSKIFGTSAGVPCGHRSGSSSKGILRIAVLHDAERDGGADIVKGCVPVLIMEDGGGSHEAMWLEEFYLLEAGRGVAMTSQLPPSNRTIETNVYVPAHAKVLFDLI